MANLITAIAIDCADPELLAGFWTAVLGWQVTDRDDDMVSIGAPTAPFWQPLCLISPSFVFGIRRQANGFARLQRIQLEQTGWPFIRRESR